MKAFFHCHKAGGTTVVKAAIASGMQLPARHRNGNPIDADDQRIDWDLISDEEALDTLRRLQDSGVDLLCFEFNTPSWRVLEQIEGLQTFTVIREPLSRTFSNYRNDVVAGALTDGIYGFASYTAVDKLFRAPNFYTRFFTRAEVTDRLTIDHLHAAIAYLEDMERVAVLERGNLGAQLEGLGFAPDAFEWKNANANKTKFKKLLDRGSRLDVTTYPTDPGFCEKNALDMVLYSYFLNKAVHGSMG